MWTIITWDRERNQWFHMRGFSDETQATEKLEQWIEEALPHTILSLSDPDGIVVTAGIGTHPSVGWCDKGKAATNPEYCWCLGYDSEFDHTMQVGSSNT